MNWLQDLLTNPNSIAHIVHYMHLSSPQGFCWAKLNSSVFHWELHLSCLWELWSGTSVLPEIRQFFRLFLSLIHI